MRWSTAPGALAMMSLCEMITPRNLGRCAQCPAAAGRRGQPEFCLVCERSLGAIAPSRFAMLALNQ